MIWGGFASLQCGIRADISSRQNVIEFLNCGVSGIFRSSAKAFNS